MQVVPILGGASREVSTLGREGEGVAVWKVVDMGGRWRWEGGYMELWMKRWGKKGRKGGEVAYLLSSLSSCLAGEGGGARAVHGGGQQDGWGPGGHSFFFWN